MSKHTPGKWTIQESYISEPTGSEPTFVEPTIWAESPDDGLDKHIAVIRCGLEGTDANARLIAAAPELLEACKSVLVTLRVSRILSEKGFDKEIANLEAVIARAEDK